MDAQTAEAGASEAGKWNRPACLYAVLIAANIAAWAWVFGLRHAVDADHIAAIDNVMRKLMQDGKRPIDAGFGTASRLGVKQLSQSAGMNR
jgi:high-affinity nickel permease